MKPPWNEIKEAYQRGEGSCRELAEAYKVNYHTLSARCSREGWRREVAEIVQKVTEKVVEKTSDRAVAWVERRLSRVKRCENDIDASREQFGEDEKGRVVMDMLNVKTMLQAELTADDIVRRAFGLKDAPDKMEAPGGLEFQKQLLMTLATIRELAAKDPKILDISSEEVQRVAQLKVIRRT